MDFMYESQNAKATRTKQVRKSSSKNNNIIPVNRYNINPIFKQNYYGRPEFCRWRQDYRVEVKAAIGIALFHLERALTEENVKKNSTIKDAIEKVMEVLQNNGLEIYPLDKKWYGQAQAGYNQISLNVFLSHKNKRDFLYSIAKTLIHEAFHIIGGCKEGQSNDSICLDRVSKDGAFKKIASRDNIESMEADDFAQFVMKC